MCIGLNVSSYVVKLFALVLCLLRDGVLFLCVRHHAPSIYSEGKK